MLMYSTYIILSPDHLVASHFVSRVVSSYDISVDIGYVSLILAGTSMCFCAWDNNLMLDDSQRSGARLGQKKKEGLNGVVRCKGSESVVKLAFSCPRSIFPCMYLAEREREY